MISKAWLSCQCDSLQWSELGHKAIVVLPYSVEMASDLSSCIKCACFATKLADFA